MNEIKIIEKLSESIINAGLCSGCGTCAGMCPVNAISFEKDIPNLDIDKCIDCGNCIKCCPGSGVDFSKIPRQVTHKCKVNVGNYISYFTSYATNNEIRKNGASGGTATALLMWALESKYVDIILSVEQVNNKTFIRVINNTDDLIKIQKSKYIPVALNSLLMECIKSKKRYAVVATPCQMQGIQKAMDVFPNLKDTIVLRIGLMCGYVQSADSIDAAANYLNIKEQNDWVFEGWRCGKYPGYVRFSNTKTREIRELSIYEAYNIVVPFYTLNKCFLCTDGLNRFADIALGDIHSDGVDKNIGIIRTQLGLEAMNQAKEKGFLRWELENDENSACASHIEFVGKIKGDLPRISIELNRKLKKSVPNYIYDEPLTEPSFLNRVILKRKAKLYMWACSKKGQDWVSKNNYDKIYKKGKYIYTYPNDTVIMNILRKIKKILRG